MSGRFAELIALSGEVAAEGTDPEHLASIVAWSTQHGHHPDALRRRVRDRHDDRAPSLLPEGPSAGTPSELLAEVAGDPAATSATSAAAALRAWRTAGARVCIVGDATYPDRLAEGWPGLDAPTWLAVRGRVDPERPAVSLVGARRATTYGTGVAAWLAEAAADVGVRVVSGGAVGVDAAAHQATLGRPGATTVVLGCGHGVAYPRPHARRGGLFDRVVDAGGAIVSESLPLDAPRAHRIRARNRIVAALADAVVVIEGGATSGSLLTATAALERGRSVLAVPGDVRAPGSEAPHRLLAEGAAPCTSPRDLLESVGGQVRAASHGSEAVTNLPAEVHRELAASWPRAVRLEDLAGRAGQPVGSLLAALTRAKVAGEVAESADGLVLRRAP